MSHKPWAYSEPTTSGDPSKTKPAESPAWLASPEVFPCFPSHHRNTSPSNPRPACKQKAHQTEKTDKPNQNGCQQNPKQGINTHGSPCFCFHKLPTFIKNKSKAKKRATLTGQPNPAPSSPLPPSNVASCLAPFPTKCFLVRACVCIKCLETV